MARYSDSICQNLDRLRSTSRQSRRPGSAPSRSPPGEDAAEDREVQGDLRDAELGGVPDDACDELFHDPVLGGTVAAHQVQPQAVVPPRQEVQQSTMRTVTLRAAVSALAWARVGEGGWKLSCSPHISRTSCVTVRFRGGRRSYQRTVDDLDRVITINQVEGMVDDLPQGRYQSRAGPHTPAHQPSAPQHRPDRAARNRWSQSKTGGQATTRSMRGSRPAARYRPDRVAMLRLDTAAASRSSTSRPRGID